jgi:hypothetical protein
MESNFNETYLRKLVKGDLQGNFEPFLNNETYEVDFITQHFDEYRYRLLTQTELEPYLNFDIDIPTIVADKPYQVFDCFFYWED